MGPREPDDKSPLARCAGGHNLVFMPTAVPALPLLLLGAWAAAGTDEGDSRPDFARDVRPLLSDRCFACHGPDAATRTAGLRLDTREGATAELPSGARAVAPGDLDGSELLYRIRPDFEADLMPPEGAGDPLTDDEVATLRAWVESGAEWGAHWSFVPPEASTPPATDGAVAPIDAYIGARLREAGLDLAPEADAATLLRRVTLDLTGLPPTPEERRAFERDAAERGLDAAYADAVDGLLASSRYGVHMARAWLDAARYADTHGLHLDNRRSIWPYRDWVVDAMNRNLPYDEFVRLQLAGDLVEGAGQEGLVASGFNRCNPSSAEGGMIADEYLTIYAKDRVDTTSTVFLGLTMACAQCHDHKFDPLSQRDYYSMAAFFSGMADAASDQNIMAPPPATRVADEEDRARLDALDLRVADLSRALEAPDPELDAREEAWLAACRADGRRWRALVPESARGEGGETMAIDPGTGIIEVSGPNPARTTYEIDAWLPPGAIRGLRIDALPGEGHETPGRAHNGNFLLTHVEVLAGPAGESPTLEVPLVEALSTYDQDGYPASAALDPSAENGWAGLGRSGPRSLFLRPGRDVGFEGGGTELRVRLQFRSMFPEHALARFRLAVHRDADVVAANARIDGWRHARYDASALADPYTDPLPAVDALRAGADLAAVHASDPELEWKDIGIVEGETLMFRSGRDVHVLTGTLHLDHAATVQLLLGSDDGVIVWVDGEEVHRVQTGRAVRIDQDRIALDLDAGDHEVAFAVVNTGGASGFVHRLLTRSSDVPLELELPHAPSGVDLDARREAIRLAWRRLHAPEWAALYDRRAEVMAEAARAREGLPLTLVSAELDEPRPTHVLMRGAYDRPGDEVAPATPAALPPMPPDARRDRLGLADWIASPDNPLTARVWANRAWQRFFGRGIVATPEDLGAQGAWPTHPELLDWLSLEFVARGWDRKSMHREIVMSRAYRQSSRVDAERLALDPDNRLVSRGPRGRLAGEVLRDSALYAAGLLDETMGGPGVRPYQPDGVWFAVAYSRSNTRSYEQGPEDHLVRRSLYTFWKRTAPPPELTLFDAPSREACAVQREVTNTPLQALVTLNSPTFVEAARFTAARALDASSGAEGVARDLFERLVGRAPTDHEVRTLSALGEALEAEYAAAPEDAHALLSVGDLGMPPPPESGERDPARLAAWTMVASAAMNLDEALTKN